MRIIIWRDKLGLTSCPYMERWVLNLYFFSIRLHHWMGSDDNRAFHDHAWWFLTIILKGGYTDVSPKGHDPVTTGSIRYRPALHRHTVKVNPCGCWSILLTGPEVRKWGFYPNGKFVRRSKYFDRYGHHPC